MSCKFFIVNNGGFILPYGYDTYEVASMNCDSNEIVYLAESLEELEISLESQQWDSDIN